jgi:hypothetical protein
MPQINYERPSVCRNQMTVSAFLIWPLHHPEGAVVNETNFGLLGSPLFWNELALA